MKSLIYITLLSLFAALLYVVPVQKAEAAAWWGEGYKKPEWVLKHGGTIIKYDVKGKSGYKARMYLGNKLIETENASRGKFDDAINNTYTVSVFKGGKKKLSQTVVAHPGETIKLTFDVKKKKVTVSSKFISRNDIKIVAISSVSNKAVQQNNLAEVSLSKKIPESKKRLTQEEIEAAENCHKIERANKFIQKTGINNVLVGEENIEILESSGLILK